MYSTARRPARVSHGKSVMLMSMVLLSYECVHTTTLLFLFTNVLGRSGIEYELHYSFFAYLLVRLLVLGPKCLLRIFEREEVQHRMQVG